ncbi:MAG: hypothetical protein ABWY36_07875 [Leifsonia sp.]
MSPEPSDMRQHRVERVLATMVATTIGLGILAIIAILIGTATGLSQSDLSRGFWIFVYWIPAVALPIGLILVIILIVISGIRRSRESRQGQS